MSGDSVPAIEGAAEVVAWFGGWPSFHDAEIVQVHIEHGDGSHLQVRCWRIEGTDESGVPRISRHALVTFHFDRVVDLELADFSPQNVVASLSVEPTERGARLVLSPCYGLAGFIETEHLAVSVAPTPHQ